MGFLPAVRRILDGTASDRQTLLFSATLDGDVAVLSRDYQRDPVRHEAGTVAPQTTDASHHFWLVDRQDRVRHTAELVDSSHRSIVFTRTRRGADRLAKQLAKMRVGAVTMHGGRSQRQRNQALRAFMSGRARALVATDVAARGIHVDEVATVIHFDPPADSKDYLHRSGRTARAGASGTVVSLVTGDQRGAVKRIQRDLDMRAPFEAPQLGDLDEQGHRIGTPSSETTNGASRPPGKQEERELRASAEAPSVYVANLPWDVTADDLTALFASHGDVQQATVITDRRTGRSKGFGFVDMAPAAAGAAVAALHGSMLDGRDLTVRFAKPRRYGG
jgi:superfamily II DNA/RNA helicase